MKKILIFSSFFVILLFFIPISIVSADLEYPPYGNEGWNKQTTGNHKVLVVMVNFNDFKNITAKEYVEERLNLLKEFYLNNSYGRLNLSFYVKDVNLSRDMRYYGEDGGFENTTWKRIDKLGYVYHSYGEDFSYQDVFANDVLEILDKEINFTDYEHIIFIHSCYDQAAEPDCNDCLWSIYMPYVNFTSNDPGEVNYGVLVGEDDNFSVIAHEFGHELGLPDLYNIETGEYVIGRYDTMDYGTRYNENFGAFSKYKLNFSTPVEIQGGNFTFSLSISNFYNSFLKVNVDNWTYFLIEYRQMVDNSKNLLIWEVKDDLANNTDMSNLMCNVSNFSESGSFNKYNTQINFSLFENFSILNISNKFFKRNISRFIKTDFCTEYENSYWPEGQPQNFSWCAEKNTRNDRKFLNNESMHILTKLNLNPGDDVNIVVKNQDEVIENFTYENLSLQRGNAYNYWNENIDNIVTNLNISNLSGMYFVEVYVNDENVYEQNFVVLNYSEIQNQTLLINAYIPAHSYKNNVNLTIKNFGGNLSEIWVDYWNKDFCNSSKKCRKEYPLEEEKVELLNENKTIELNFYGNFESPYCFQVFGKNGFQQINNTMTFCTKICKHDLALVMKILECSVGNEGVCDICYDFNFDNDVDVFDASELLEDLKDWV